MMGGSLGAQSVNEALRAALTRLLPVMQVFHLCGKGNLDESLNGLAGYYQVEFLSKELPDAMAGIQCAVTRTTLRDHVGPYLPDEAFTVQEALDSYTIRGAEASFEEHIKGRIAPGFLADFVVLGGDPFAVDPFALRDVPVLATYVNGVKVY